MPQWLPGLLVALVAIIPGVWREIRAYQEGKAETDNIIVQSYKALVADLRQQIEEEQQGREVYAQELLIVRAENDQLRDENASLLGYVQRLTAEDSERP